MRGHNKIKVGKERKTVAYFCEKYDMDKEKVLERFAKGQSVNQIFSKAVMDRYLGVKRKVERRERKMTKEEEVQRLKDFMRTKGWRV